MGLRIRRRYDESEGREMSFEYSSPFKTARVVQLIETTLTLTGGGSVGDPVRIVTQYWTLDGKLVAEVDQLKKNQEIEAAK